MSRHVSFLSLKNYVASHARWIESFANTSSIDLWHWAITCPVVCTVLSVSVKCNFRWIWRGFCGFMYRFLLDIEIYNYLKIKSSVCRLRSSAASDHYRCYLGSVNIVLTSTYGVWLIGGQCIDFWQRLYHQSTSFPHHVEDVQNGKDEDFIESNRRFSFTLASSAWMK